MSRSTGAQLLEVYQLIGPLYRRAVRSVTDSGPGAGLPVGVRAVLEYLEVTSTPVTVPHLAADLALARQVVQRSADEGAARGLLEAVPNPRHRRSPLIALTDPGRALIDEVHTFEGRALAAAARTLDRDDVERCLRVLRALLQEV